MSRYYMWAQGYQSPLNPQVAGERIRQLTELHGGSLTADIVVRDAKSPESPLHRHFEWNDRVAAHEYRLEQARSLIRCLRVVVEPVAGPKNARRLMIHLRPIAPPQTTTETQAPRGPGVYMPAEQALDNPYTREQMVTNALAGLRSWRQKHAELEELQPIFEAIDRYVLQYDGEAHHGQPARPRAS